MAGGDLSEATLVTEQYLLDLEREAFLSLCTERKTLERIQFMLTKGSPFVIKTEKKSQETRDKIKSESAKALSSFFFPL